jgi:hypothetical protein
MTLTIFQMGYADTLGLLKVAAGPELMVDTKSTWLPPGAAQPAYHVSQGSEAAAKARAAGVGGSKPGLLGKAWSKFRGLPGKAQLGIGLGAAGLLGGAGLLASRAKDKPPSRFEEQNMQPELQAAPYRQAPTYAHNEAYYPPYR